jgi:demethylmenaquinone methyltransferase / 2-methoxy-6-polyprenyl-1,4-benzoquinol methylase
MTEPIPPEAGTPPGPDPGTIHEMFRAIAGRYDRANDILSLGIHHLWRRRVVRWSGVRPGDRVLDCATGTGDLAIAFRNAVGETGMVTGTDFVPEMVDLARQKGSRYRKGLRFEIADVTRLPYASESFEVASISFGIRNVGDPRAAVSELARVVGPGGRVLILEFGQPRSALFGRLYDFYRRHLLPRLGGWITGRRQAYDYLERSAGTFPCGDQLAELVRTAARFERVEWRAVSGGIAYVYRAVKASS